MAIFSSEFKNAVKNTAKKCKASFKGFAEPWKPSKEQKLAKLEAQIKTLRKEMK